MNFFARSQWDNRLTLIALIGYAILLWGVFFSDMYFPQLKEKTFTQVGFILWGVVCGALYGYTFAGTRIGYKRTIRHLGNRGNLADPEFKAKIDQWYCYRIGYRIALQENGLKPPT